MASDQDEADHHQATSDTSSQASEAPSYSDYDSYQESEEDTDETHEEKMEKWASQVEEGSFEEQLLQCVVNTDSIPLNYEQIAISPSTIQKLERITTLSLQRPKAFSHGVLQGHRLTGALLYGPPGEHEQAVKAIFNLARIMHPCIILIDEADAIFTYRSHKNPRDERSMYSIFLTEWDGLMTDATSPFVLLASSRPCDLDPAVVRRAPVQIYLNVIDAEERARIFDILLKGELLASDVSMQKLADLTPRYTGSDLKNLCIAAALECVREQPKDTRSRIITKRHFVLAKESVKATKMHKGATAYIKKFIEGSK